MTRITRSETVGYGAGQFFSMRRQVFVALLCAVPGSQEQREALSSIHNIEAELAIRSPGP